MSSYDPTVFNIDPYYDDYSDDKHFYRMLFRPGFAVQARELTQVQTLLQKQVERFGNHVFENGSMVADGQITENRVRFVRVTGLSGTSDISDFDGIQIGCSGYASARVFHVDSGLTNSSLDSSGVLYFDYLEGGSGFTSGIVLSGTANSTAIYARIAGLTSITGSALGTATLVNVDSGIRFVDGFFVLSEEQKIAIYDTLGTAGNTYRDFSAPTVRVGFDVNKSIVSSITDESLNDPAFGSYNYNAPGADRYKIDLTLAQYEFTPTDTSSADNFGREGFIEFVRFVDGDTIKKETYPDYAVIEDTLARRTYDESGNYTVRPFDLIVTDSGVSADKLSANLDPGKAYIFGYEFETQGTTKLSLDRARTSRSVSDRFLNRSIGPYLEVSFGGSANSVGLTFDIAKQPNVILSSGTGTSATVSVGTARTRMINHSGTPGKQFAYLYDISLTAGASISDVKRIFLTSNTTPGKQLFDIPAGTTASLNEETSNNLLLRLPEGNTTKTITAFDYTVNSSFPNITFVGGVATITKQFDAFDVDQSVSPQIPQPAMIVFDKNGKSLTGSLALISAGTQMEITLQDTSVTGASVIVNEQITSLSRIRTKGYTAGYLTLSGSDASLTTDSTGKYFLYLNRYTDVYAVSGITGKYLGATANITSYFTLDTGQKDNVYDWSKLVLKSGLSAASFTGPYSLYVERFTHSGVGPFTVDSYTGATSSSYLGFESIPQYTSVATGVVYNLRDVLDFRPAKDSTGDTISALIPTDDTANKVSYQYYLPRTDKIALSRDRNFKVIQGIADVNAPIPPDDNDSMTLYSIRVNPFTFSGDDVNVRYVENKRYTMRDIGKLEKRVDYVEYYTTLSLLEQDAKNTSVRDSLDLEVPKLGILVDSFRGHNIGDVKDPMYAASIDFDNSTLLPKFRTRIYGMEQTGVISSIVGSNDGLYTLNYTTTPWIAQPLASNSTNINNSGLLNYLGVLTLSPSSDTWYDDTRVPLVRVNVEGENDAWIASATGNGFGTQWNDWETNWFGRQIISEQTQRPNKDGVSNQTELTLGTNNNILFTRNVPESIRRTIANRVFETNVVPYIRSKDLSISAKGLKPNTRFYPFFDGINVSSYCSGSLTSNSYGEITGLTFGIPSGTFYTGQRLFRLIDNDGNTVSTSSSAAETIYRSQGLLSNREDGVVSTRVPNIRREGVKTETIITSVFNRSKQQTGNQYSGATDALSQTFVVDQTSYPSGLFVKQVDLYFKTKPTSNEPVILQIRPTVNGYPHPSRIVPLSEVIVYPASVSVSDTGTSATEFEFSSPIYLAPGEYTISLLSASDQYSVFTAVLGENKLKAVSSETDRKISAQPYIGRLYKPQNAGTFVPTEYEDLTFVIHRCVFDPTGTVQFTNIPSSTYGSTITGHNYRLNVEQIVPPGTDVIYSEVGVLNKQVSPNENTPTYAASTFSNVGSSAFTSLFATVSTDNELVSPVIDSDRFDTLLIENVINNSSLTASNNELRPDNSGASLPSATRYITKRVTLDGGIRASNLRVLLNASIPTNASIQVFARTLADTDNVSFDDKNYIQLSATKYPVSSNEDDYQEYEFTFASDQVPTFKTFSIKIVMYSSDSGVTIPRIRNMRVIAI